MSSTFAKVQPSVKGFHFRTGWFISVGVYGSIICINGLFSTIQAEGLKVSKVFSRVVFWIKGSTGQLRGWLRVSLVGFKIWGKHEVVFYVCGSLASGEISALNRMVYVHKFIGFPTSYMRYFLRLDSSWGFKSFEGLQRSKSWTEDFTGKRRQSSVQGYHW